MGGGLLRHEIVRGTHKRAERILQDDSSGDQFARSNCWVGGCENIETQSEQRKNQNWRTTSFETRRN